jgi:3-polyprenyl-4-hydroxybenzoate decarboxylase
MQTQNAAVAAIQFALETDDGLAFLRCWKEGNFDAIRREWPEAPVAVFVGADPLHTAAAA